MITDTTATIPTATDELAAELASIRARLTENDAQLASTRRQLRVTWAVAALSTVALFALGWHKDALARGYQTGHGLTLAQAAARLNALEAKTQNITRITDPNTGKPTVRISGVNVQIVDGAGKQSGKSEVKKAAPSGLGNLIIGYNEPRRNGSAPDLVSPVVNARTGSHNLIVGNYNNYTGSGGSVFGKYNTISGEGATVTGGQENTASGSVSSVSGGDGNVALGPMSSALGGYNNTPSGDCSTVAGGNGNTASGHQATVSGGVANCASGVMSCVAGGSEVQQPITYGFAAGGLTKQGVGTFHSP